MRFESLQALRGSACLMVVAYHISNYESQLGLGFNPFRCTKWFGFAGVDLFFVLSGFIITSTSWDDFGRIRELPRYAFRRMWRIYPVYWVVLVIATCVDLLLSPDPLIGRMGFAEWLRSIFLPPHSDLPRVLPVAWTLRYELAFYLAFGLLFMLPRAAGIPAIGTWACVVLAITLVGRAEKLNEYETLVASPFVLEFLAGAAVASRGVRLDRARFACLVAIAFSWASCGVLLACDSNPDSLSNNQALRVLAFGAPAAMLVAALTGRERVRPLKFPRSLTAAGDASYSIYLLHLPCLIVAHYLALLLNFPHNRPGHMLWLAVMCASAVLPGMIFHRYVESPLMRLAKRKRAIAAPVANPPMGLAA